jgi:TonB-linked SusC/RagA family outer membrane protein
MRFILPESGPFRQKLLKAIIVMKLIVILITVTLQVSAAAYSQQISLNFKNTPLREVMQAVRKQTGYSYMVSTENLKLAKPVTVNIKSTSIEETLHAIFVDQPITYKVEGKVIMIRERVVEKETDTKLVQKQQRDIGGIITDEQGNPLPGATVILKEQTFRVSVTDGEGRFSFSDAPDQGTILVRMIGRETKEVKYKNNSVINIALKEVNADLNEVQIIAYGQVNKKFSTSNIGSIKAADIAKQPVSNPLLALQGRVPGLFIQQSSGNTISNVNVTIQGPNSINSGNNPFYVVDGVPYVNNNNNGIEGPILRLGGNSTMNFINPSDIESIEILKDADATAIYGSRAANGAILITTKRGKPGATKVDLNLQNGWGKITRMYDLMNTDQYIVMRKESLLNDNQTIQTTDYDINETWDSKRNTNWQKELAGGTAHFNNISAAISGGTSNTQFRAGAGFIRQTSVYIGDFSDTKNNVQLSINHHSDDQRFNFNLSANYLQDRNLIPNTDLFLPALKLAPNAPSLFNADGSLNWGPVSNNPGEYSFDNPANAILVKYQANTNNLISNSLIGYKILEGLEIKVSLGYNKLDNKANVLTPDIYYRPDYSYRPRTATFSNSSITSWITEPQLTYERDFSFGHIDALLGSTFQESKTDLLNLDASGFNNDGQLSNPAAGTSLYSTTVQTLYRYSAIFGRLNYRVNDRYILNLIVRRDGSSRFGMNNQFHNFYSVGGAWILSEESFMKNLKPAINFAKLKASYGTTGNDQIADYAFLSLYNNRDYSINYQDNPGLQPAGLPNPYLKWEETKKLNVGLDLGFMDNRLSFSMNFFRNRSTNQLVYATLPTTSGFPFIYSNLPATVQNEGIELSIDANPVKLGLFDWHISGNFTSSKNKLVEFPNLDNSLYANTFVIGQPTSLIKAYNYSGVNAQTGLYQFTDSQGKLTSDPNYVTDRTDYISTLPKWYAGLTNTITYKNWDLDILLQYVSQVRELFRYQMYYPGIFNTNQPASIVNRWQKNGDGGPSQKITQDGYNSFSAASGSNAAYGNANYLRLKNVAISYALPSAWITRLHLSKARFYLASQNLLTITNYEGDPETGVGTLPPLKMFSLGLQLTF